MALIKRADQDRRAHGGVVLDLADVAEAARGIEREAHRQARQVLDEAKRERERLLSTAHAEGFAKGHAEGFEKGKGEGHDRGFREAVEGAGPRIEAVSHAWREAIGQFELRTRAMEDEARDGVVQLALELASRVIKRVVSGNPEAVVDQVRAAIGLVMESTRVVVLVHPDDLAVVELAWPMLIERLGKAERATLRGDETVGRGGCVVRTGERGQGTIDARIQTQLDRLAEALLPGPMRAAPQPGGEA